MNLDRPTRSLPPQCLKRMDVATGAVLTRHTVTKGQREGGRRCESGRSLNKLHNKHFLQSMCSELRTQILVWSSTLKQRDTLSTRQIRWHNNQSRAGSAYNSNCHVRRLIVVFPSRRTASLSSFPNRYGPTPTPLLGNRQAAKSFFQ